MRLNCPYLFNFSVLATVAGIFSFASCAEHSTQITNMSEQKISAANTDTASFGTGCFWCTEAIYERLNGVVKVISGYSGGNIPDPTYEEVSTGTTGHAECCQIIYDPSVISFDELLHVFWKTHDPTSLNRQGNDVGPQYRSVIFYHNERQKELAEKYKQELNDSNVFNKPVVTAIEPFKNFYKAEDYHQNYFDYNPGQMYCRLVILPKVEKFERIFKDKLKTSARKEEMANNKD
ncbi:MAG: peptide-methionine (S)-S-oxide reductase MsrA [Bacteroidetes bacterium]|nr:peptide-methionine (S)-S-oxide reductase MsrA [Bacteroidota bacterium]